MVARVSRRRSSSVRRRPRRTPAISDSMAAQAVMAQVGTGTAMSLATKRRSSKLGAGLGTMVMETKKAARAMSTKKRTVRRKRKSPLRKTRKGGVRKVTRRRKTRKTLRKRKSLKRRSLRKRRSLKRKSLKRKSLKRKSLKRKSPKRKSPKPLLSLGW